MINRQDVVFYCLFAAFSVLGIYVLHLSPKSPSAIETVPTPQMKEIPAPPVLSGQDKG